MSKPTYYLTTPIYYPNDKLHIGHAYTTVAADALARYKRLRGFDVMYLTGTDEHGQKIQGRAMEAGKSALDFLDEIIVWIKDLWERLDISNDDFIRTTEERHKQVVAKLFERLIDQEDIYLGEYEGWYCTPDESFWSERELKDGKCPECGRDVQLVKEQSYFFRMSKYVDRLLQYYTDHPDFIQPESRKNEMINNFLKPGLQDLCVSRTSFDWGIRVSRSPEHVVYVWLDALTNYITAIGYGSDNPELQAKFERYWPADVHFVGKDIVRFHTIYWPIILMALGLPLPKKVYGHGHFMMKDGKMSKSRGNVIDPKLLIERYGSDAIRYFLLREVPFGQDGVFTPEALVQRLNFDLANVFGNLSQRTESMINRFAAGTVPAPASRETVDEEIAALAEQSVQDVAAHLEEMQFSLALSAIWRLVRQGNKYIDETAPWSLYKNGNEERLRTVLYTMVETVRYITVLTQPFLTKGPLVVAEQYGFAADEMSWDSLAHFGQVNPGRRVQPGVPLFPRLEMNEELEALASLTGVRVGPAAKAIQAEKESKQPMQEVQAVGKEQIGIDVFGQVELKVGQVKEADKVEGADKLLRLQIDLGAEVRQIVSGIAKYYTPESLIGQKVVVVTNLKPVKLRGVESNGMILAASQGDALVVVTVPESMPNGALVK